MHLQFSEQRMLAWKHSQYFFKHPDFLQWHPLLCFPNTKTSPASSLTSRVAWGLLAIFGLKAFGLRSKVASTASRRAASFSTLLQQLEQLHPSQYIPDAKHSQYNFKHFECLQLHCFCFFGVPSFTSKLGLGLDFGDSGFLRKVVSSIAIRKTMI